MTLGVLVADDQLLMLEALERLLNSTDDFEVTGTARDGNEAVSKYLALRPDLVLMDIRMPRLNGIEATRQITEHDPSAKVVILTTFTTLDHVIPALRAGAVGFYVKDTSFEDLLQALRDVHTHSTERSLAPEIVRLLSHYATEATARSHAAHGATITERERETLQLLAQGLSNSEIAASLLVSEGSVKAYLGRVCEKLQVRDRLQAVIKAYELGLVTPRLGQLDR